MKSASLHKAPFIISFSGFLFSMLSFLEDSLTLSSTLLLIRRRVSGVVRIPIVVVSTPLIHIDCWSITDFDIWKGRSPECHLAVLHLLLHLSNLECLYNLRVSVWVLWVTVTHISKPSFELKFIEFLEGSEQLGLYVSFMNYYGLSSHLFSRIRSS